MLEEESKEEHYLGGGDGEEVVKKEDDARQPEVLQLNATQNEKYIPPPREIDEKTVIDMLK